MVPTVTILRTVPDRLASARLYANLRPAPFTPPAALVRRCEDLVAAGVDVVQLSLEGWSPDDALGVVREASGIVVAASKLLVVSRDVDLASAFGADVVVLGPGQPLPPEGALPASSVVGRDAYDLAAVRAGFEEDGLGLLVLRNCGYGASDSAQGRAADMVAHAFEQAPLGARGSIVDAGGGARPWFVDVGSAWTDARALPTRACRVRFDVFVPSDSPVDAASEPLRADVASLRDHLAEVYAQDPGIRAAQQAVQQDNSAASTGFRAPRDGEHSEPTVAIRRDQLAGAEEAEPAGAGTGQDPMTSAHDSFGAEDNWWSRTWKRIRGAFD